MITTDINRAEFTGNGIATDYVFASSGTDIPVKNQAHIKVYLTNTGTFTANASTEVFTNVTLDGVAQTSHGHLNTEVIRVSAATTLPAGLIINTDYYIREKAATTFKLELSVGGGVVPITTTGTGTLTWTKTLLQVLTTAYTVKISGTTATVTFLTPPPNTVGILLIREVPFEQNTDLLNNSLIEAESLESQLDLIVNQTQQLKNTFDRQLKFSEILDATDATETAVTLNVTSANRASKGLKFDASGNLAVSDIDIDQSQDYTLESQSWATESPAAVNTYDDSVSTPVSPTAYSSKEHAVGTPPDGSAKEWAQDTSGIVASSEYSAKEYAIGTTVAAGSAKDWALLSEDSVVDGGSGYSSLHHSAKSLASATAAAVSETAANASADAVSVMYDAFHDKFLGSMSDAVVLTASSDAGLLITSAAHGLVNTQIIRVVNSGGALPGNLSVSTDYYVRDQTTNTFRLATSSGGTAIAYSSAGSGTNTWYYGDFATPSTSSWIKNSSTITVASNIGIRVGQVVSGSGIEATPKPNVISIAGTAISISDNMDAVGSSVAVTFANKGIYGAFNVTKDGPDTNNDGDALTDGLLYFNTTDDVLKVYDLDDTLWRQTAPTSAEQTTIDTVAGISANVTTVAGISANVTTVAGISANTTTVAGISGNVTTVAGISANTTTVAGINSNVTTVAGISANVTTVAGAITNVNTTATNIADVNNFADVYQIHSFSPSAPTTDGGGNAVAEGDLAFDTTSNVVKAYTGSAWITATVSDVALLAGATFTGAVIFNVQPTFSGGIGIVKEATSQFLSGAITESYCLSLAYIVTGNVTFSGNVILGKMVDGTTGISITNDGSTRTISGSGTVTFNNVLFN